MRAENPAPPLPWGPVTDDPRPALPRLAVAYDLSSSSPMELREQLDGLCEVVWIVDGADPSLGSMARLLRRLGTVIDTSAIAGRGPGELADDVVDAVAAAGVSGVIAFTDTQLALSARLARSLGLPGNSLETVERLNDKHRQRQALAAAGVAGPRFVGVPAAATADDAIAAAGSLTFPVVVKPLVGDSSRGVVALADATALAGWFDAAAAQAEARADLIIEEYLADREDAGAPGRASYVSVESIVDTGRVVPLAVTGKFPLVEPFRETGNFMPHPLGADEAAAVVDVAAAAAVALGVQSGALHTEVKLTPAGPRIIEVNGRIGGGAIDLLHTRRFGVSMTRLAAQVALGIPADLRPEPVDSSDGPFLYEFFLQPPTSATRLVAIGAADRIIGTAGAQTVAPNRSVGDALDWRSSGSQGFVMRVGGVARDRAELATVPTAITAAAGVTFA